MSSVTIHGNTYDDVQAVNYVDKSGNQYSLKKLVLNGTEIWKSTQGYSLSFESETTLTNTTISGNKSLQCYSSIDVDADTGEYILGETITVTAFYYAASHYKNYPFFLLDSEYYKTISASVSVNSFTLTVQKCIVVQG